MYAHLGLPVLDDFLYERNKMDFLVVQHFCICTLLKKLQSAKKIFYRQV